MTHFRLVGLLLVTCTSTFLATGANGQVAMWGRWDGRFTAAQSNPDAALTITLTSPSGQEVSIAGFWEGERDFGARFMPTEAGTWSFQTTSMPQIEGLHGQAGSFEVAPAAGDNPLFTHGPLQVAADGRYLAYADGTPFFWLGDTTWNGPVKSSANDWQTYLNDRAQKRFNVIQYNAVAPWRAADTDEAGQVAFEGRSEVRINPAYFQRLDKRIDAINEAGMVAAHVLIWSLTEKDPGSYLPEEDIQKLIRYQLARYGANHVVWILAGDNPYNAEQAEKWKRIGRVVFAARPQAVVTTHPTGMNFPWQEWENEEWLDVLGYQSGHGDDTDKWKWIHAGPAAAYWQNTTKPIVNLEPCYEDHLSYHSRQRHSAHNVRRDVYYSLLSHPPAGVTYGGHGIWSWQTVQGEEPADHEGTGVAKIWHEAMNLPGSRHMQHMVEVFTSIEWWKLRPDEQLVRDQPHADDPARRVVAATTTDGAASLVYLPIGGTIALAIGTSNKAATWFDPRTGDQQRAAAEGGERFTAPSDDDWVLVLRNQ